MIINKSVRAFFALTMLAVSSVALTASSASAKPAVRSGAPTHQLDRMPAHRAPTPHVEEPYYDTFAGRG